MKYNINLIGKKELGVVDKALYFFLNYLRYILVITQLVVIGVLFFRFKVDQSVIDLKDSVDQQKEIIQVVQPLLVEAKKIDDQSIGIKQVLSSQERFLSSLQYIFSIFPEGLQLDTLTFGEGAFKLEGTVLIPQQLQLFYNKLQKEGKFSSVKLATLGREEAGLTFSLQLALLK